MNLTTALLLVSFALAVGIASLLVFPCSVSVPIVSFDNLLLDIVVFVCVLVLTWRMSQLREKPTRALALGIGVFAVVTVVSLVLISDWGILILGKRVFVELADGTQSPMKRACYCSAVLRSTQYGPDVFVKEVNDRITMERRSEIFTAAAEVAPSEAWKTALLVRSQELAAESSP